MPKISVILAAYNAEQYLAQCVDSLLCQTLRDIEIVAVDDGSADGTGSMLDKYAAADTRVVVIHQQNTGVSAARNAGIARSSGEYIAFIDGDDWAEPDMCEHAFLLAIETGAELVMWNNFFNSPDSESRISMYPGDRRLMTGGQIADIQRLIIDSELSEPGCASNATFIWAKLWKRAALARYAGGWFPENLAWGEDQVFNLRHLDGIRLAVYTNRALYHYRVNSASVTHAFRPDRLQMFALYLGELRRFVNEKAGDGTFEQAYHKRVVFTLILAVRVHFINPSNSAGFRAKAAGLKAMMRSEPYASALAAVNPGDFNSGRGVFVALAKRNAASLLLILSKTKGLLSARV